MIRILLLILFCGTSLHAQVGSLDNSTHIKEIFRKLNVTRIKHGKLPLSYREEHQNSCDKWAVYISKKFRHNTDYKILSEMILANHSGEAKTVIPQFMDSPPHKKGLLDWKARGVCVAVYIIPGDTIVTSESSYNGKYLPRMYTVIRTYR